MHKSIIYIMYVKLIITAGQLISKCPFGVIVWTKTPTNFFPGFLLASKKWLNQKKTKEALYFSLIIQKLFD